MSYYFSSHKPILQSFDLVCHNGTIWYSYQLLGYVAKRRKTISILEHHRGCVFESLAGSAIPGSKTAAELIEVLEYMFHHHHVTCCYFNMI